MSVFESGLPAEKTHAGLKSALTDLRRAEKNAVLWFAEIMRRKLYRELGYSSIHMYAGEALGFSRSKTYQFIGLAESFERLPALRDSLTAGEIPWTKAVCVARVATPGTEKRWLKEAKVSGRRELESKAKQSRALTRSERDSSQQDLMPKDSSSPSSSAAGDETREAKPDPVPPAPVSMSLRFSPEQYARAQGLIEELRKQGRKGNREELFLEALATLASSSEKSSRLDNSNSGQTDEKGRKSPPSKQIIIYRCEDCGEAKYPDGRRLTATGLAAAECDAGILKPGKRNRAVIPPARRRSVLARDRHRCRVTGCHSTRFLEVHHMKPRKAGGGNEPANLITLCSACHQLAHEKDLSGLIGKQAPPGQ